MELMGEEVSQRGRRWQGAAVLPLDPAVLPLPLAVLPPSLGGLEGRGGTVPSAVLPRWYGGTIALERYYCTYYRCKCRSTRHEMRPLESRR